MNIETDLQFIDQLQDIHRTLRTILQGCHALVEMDTALSKQIDKNQQNIKEITAWISLVDTRIAKVNERVDVYNKRLRKLEQESRRQRNEMRVIQKELK